MVSTSIMDLSSSCLFRPCAAFSRPRRIFTAASIGASLLYKEGPRHGHNFPQLSPSRPQDLSLSRLRASPTNSANPTPPQPGVSRFLHPHLTSCLFFLFYCLPIHLYRRAAPPKSLRFYLCPGLYCLITSY
jgi:hypothetical protein